ncbi:MAG: isochorismatase family protein [Gemmataceae bacterium]|nr:isochorismatase family protein [Gemmataceae bacterium]
MRAVLLVGLVGVAAGVGAPAGGDDAGRAFKVVARKRVPVSQARQVEKDDGTIAKVVGTSYRAETFGRTIDPGKTAVVVCDMWDDHWCRAAAKRCDALARQAEPVLRACRGRGMTVIHAPSDCMDFYKDHPARQRMRAVAKADPPKDKDVPCPPLPVDDSDGGCDDPQPAKEHRVWTRQHAAITIDPDKDYVTDDGREVYGLLRTKGITTVVVMGVHTDKCVLNRSFAVKQMVKWGVDTLLVRDLTDSMYNPEMKPFVSHEAGTNLIIEYIEAHWCPTVEAKGLAGVNR